MEDGKGLGELQKKLLELRKLVENHDKVNNTIKQLIGEALTVCQKIEKVPNKCIETQVEEKDIELTREIRRKQ